jgi:tRNA(Met) cytidine acetyltransferase
VGYGLVRVGASRGARTGEPAAVMLRPVSEAGRELYRALRAQLARDLSLALAMLEGGDLPVDAALQEAMAHDLPAPAPLQEDDVDEAVDAYVFGPRPLEAAAAGLRAWLADRSLDGLSAADRRLIQGRLFDLEGWDDVAAATGHPHPRAAMRALKRALRSVRQADPSSKTGRKPST